LVLFEMNFCIYTFIWSYFFAYRPSQSFKCCYRHRKKA